LIGFERVSFLQILVEGKSAHPFDLTIYGDFLFWTDWVLHAVIRVNKTTGLNPVSLRTELRPMGIVAVYNNTDDCEFTLHQP